MLRISVICQGRLKEKYYADACAEYLKRLSAYGAAEVVELPEESDVAARIPKGAYVIALVVGTVVNYVVGVALFCAVAKASVATGITACVLPFIPTAIIKAILASVIGFAIRERVPELKK